MNPANTLRNGFTLSTPDSKPRSFRAEAAAEAEESLVGKEDSTPQSEKDFTTALEMTAEGVTAGDEGRCTIGLLRQLTCQDG